MRARGWILSMAMVVGTASAVPVGAHHGWSGYDGDKTLTLSGVIPATSVRASASTPSTWSSRRASASRPAPTWTRTRRSSAERAKLGA
jgi:hypothetical protein